MMTKLLKVGIEIEGEYSVNFLTKIKNFGVIKGDGSLRNCSGCDLLLREFNSEPLKVTSSKIKNIFEEYIKAYNNKEFHFNDSCGLHFHFSFKPIMPPEIFSDEFVEYFKKQLREVYPKVWDKRSGNSFCKINDKGQVMRCGERYRMINFMPAFERHKTIEFRIYPTDNPETMYEYFRFTVKTMKEFSKKKIELKAEIDIGDLKTYTNSFTQEIILNEYVQTDSGN